MRKKPSKRSAASKKGWATRRSKAAARSAAARKGWATRRAHSAKTALKRSKRTKVRTTKKTPYRYVTTRGVQTGNNLHYGFQGLSKADATALTARMIRDGRRLIAQHGDVDFRVKVQMTREAFKRRYTVRNKMPDDFSYRDDDNLVTFWTDPVRIPGDEYRTVEAFLDEVFHGTDEERSDDEFESYHDEILILEAEYAW